MSRENITFGGDAINILGKEIKVGDKVPDFKAVNNDLSPFESKELNGKVRIYSVVPSIARNPQAQIRFNDEYVYSASEDGGQPSEFSSWGLTPNGNLKPDIAAPGGGILSSLNDNQYGVMDGTSMAAPHVAGGVALVKQRVEKDFPEVHGDKKYDLIKKLLMSTAQPYKYKDSGAYASPRQQGSGLMQVDKAISATAFIEGSHGLTSINLGKSLSGDKVTVPFKIVNMGDKAKTYTYYGVLNTDKVEDGKIVLRPQKISESVRKTVTVEPHQSVELTVELPVTGLDKPTASSWKALSSVKNKEALIYRHLSSASTEASTSWKWRKHPFTI